MALIRHLTLFAITLLVACGSAWRESSSERFSAPDRCQPLDAAMLSPNRQANTSK